MMIFKNTFWLLLFFSVQVFTEYESSTSQQAEFIQNLFAENAREYAKLDVQELYANDNDIVWQDNPKQWHQQIARTVDHRFSTFNELETFAKNAKKAGVSVLMLVQVQKTEACPGGWYNGLQLCDHINGSFPAADGTLDKWQKMLQEIKPMRLMWWANMCYWSTQGQVWAEAKADKYSDVGRWFSWNATDADQCWGKNPDGAQGSWGSDGSFKGYESALSSWGSDSYVEYLVDAMANSWTQNLGIDGYCIDCVSCYNKNDNCKNGMRQTNDAEASWGKLVQKVRQQQPQVVLSAEWYSSWSEVIKANGDVGGQGEESYHDKMQQAVFNGDASNLEDIASTSGADAATVLCYLNPYYDGKQPGACPTMYYRDMSATIKNIKQHRMWVALEAGSGIVPQHDFNPVWWNVTNDPFDDSESPIWAFTKYRALNRLALRTKLNVNGNRGALVYLKHDSMGPYGDACLMVFNPGSAGKVTIDLSMFPPTLFGVVPYDLLKKDLQNQTDVPPLSKSWTLEMGAGDMKFFSGFSLGVFAPRKGKKNNCKADDQYIKKANGKTLQTCFLECLNNSHCENVFVEYVDIYWTEKPPSVNCTLLGVIKDPAAACAEGTGTLIKKLPGARSCAHLWQSSGEMPTPAPGSPPVFPGPLSSKCNPRSHSQTQSNNAV